METGSEQQAVRPIAGRPALSVGIRSDDLRAMFHLLAGKPDSKIKLLHRPIFVTADDIVDINRKVFEKLNLHHTGNVVVSATLKFNKEESIQFGTWPEFQCFDWKIPRETEELSLRWDFLLDLQNSSTPRRHTLTVRISKAPRPRDFIQMVLSQDPDEDDDIQGRFAFCVVRVDFISHRLADELIDVVQSWNESLLQPDAAHGWFARLERWDQWIARAVHYSVPVFICWLAIAVLKHLVPTHPGPIGTETLRLIAEWTLLSILILYVTSGFSRFLASKCFQAVNQYGIFVPFKLTNGDQRRLERYALKNRKCIRTVCISAGGAFVLNVLAGIVTFWLLQGQ